MDGLHKRCSTVCSAWSRDRGDVDFETEYICRRTLIGRTGTSGWCERGGWKAMMAHYGRDPVGNCVSYLFFSLLQEMYPHETYEGRMKWEKKTWTKVHCRGNRSVGTRSQNRFQGESKKKRLHKPPPAIFFLPPGWSPNADILKPWNQSSRSGTILRKTDGSSPGRTVLRRSMNFDTVPGTARW